MGQPREPAAGVAEQLARNIRAVCDERLMSLRSLAAAVGFSRSTLYRRLDGDDPWTYEELLTVAAHLAVPIERITAGVEVGPAQAQEVTR